MRYVEAQQRQYLSQATPNTPTPCPSGWGEEAAVPLLPPPSSLLCTPSPIEAISKEEQGDYMEKLFSKTKGTHSFSGARRRGIEKRCVELTLEVDKWEMGWGKMSLGREDWGAEHTHGLCALSSFLSCPQKLKNGNCEQGCEEILFQRSRV